MDICDHDHEQIVYDSYKGCPLCLTNAEIVKLEDTISNLNDEISELNDVVYDLEMDILELQEHD